MEVCGLKVTPEGFALAVSLDPLSHTRLTEIPDGAGDGATGAVGGEHERHFPAPVLVLIAALEVMVAAVADSGGAIPEPRDVLRRAAPVRPVPVLPIPLRPKYAGGVLEDLATRVPSALRILVVSAGYSWPSVPDDRVHLREVARESWLSEVAGVLRPLGVGVAGRSQFACLEDLVGAVDDHFGEGLREGEDFDWRAVRDHLIAGPLRSRLDLLTRTEFF